MPQPLLNRSPGSPRPPTRESRRRIVITDTAETSDPGHATAEEFAHPEDGTAYLAMLQRFLDNATAIGGFLGSELRSPKVVRHAIHLLRREGLAGTEAWLRDTVTSGRSYCRREFRGDEADLLWVPGCCTPDFLPTTPPAAGCCRSWPRRSTVSGCPEHCETASLWVCALAYWLAETTMTTTEPDVGWPRPEAERWSSSSLLGTGAPN